MSVLLLALGSAGEVMFARAMTGSDSLSEEQKKQIQEQKQVRRNNNGNIQQYKETMGFKHTMH